MTTETVDERHIRTDYVKNILWYNGFTVSGIRDKVMLELGMKFNSFVQKLVGFRREIRGFQETDSSLGTLLHTLVTLNLERL